MSRLCGWWRGVAALLRAPFNASVFARLQIPVVESSVAVTTPHERRVEGRISSSKKEMAGCVAPLGNIFIISSVLQVEFATLVYDKVSNHGENFNEKLYGENLN